MYSDFILSKLMFGTGIKKKKIEIGTGHIIFIRTLITQIFPQSDV